MKCLQCSKEGLIELIIVNYFVDLVSESHKTRSVTLHREQGLWQIEKRKRRGKERRKNKIKWLKWERGAKESLQSTRKLVTQQSFHYATIHLMLVGKRTSYCINISPARMCQLDLVIFHFCGQEVPKREEESPALRPARQRQWEKQVSTPSWQITAIYSSSLSSSSNPDHHPGCTRWWLPHHLPYKTVPPFVITQICSSFCLLLLWCDGGSADDVRWDDGDGNPTLTNEHGRTGGQFMPFFLPVSALSGRCNKVVCFMEHLSV